MYQPGGECWERSSKDQVQTRMATAKRTRGFSEKGTRGTRLREILLSLSFSFFLSLFFVCLIIRPVLPRFDCVSEADIGGWRSMTRSNRLFEIVYRTSSGINIDSTFKFHGWYYMRIRCAKIKSVTNGRMKFTFSRANSCLYRYYTYKRPNFSCSDTATINPPEDFERSNELFIPRPSSISYAC